MTREQKPHLAAVANPDAELLAIEARRRALEAKIVTLPEETPDLVIETLTNQSIVLSMQIARTPAQGIGGIAVKLRQLMATITELRYDFGSTEWAVATIRSALEAPERLAGGGDPAGDGARKGGRLH